MGLDWGITAGQCEDKTDCIAVWFSSMSVTMKSRLALCIMSERQVQKTSTLSPFWSRPGMSTKVTMTVTRMMRRIEELEIVDGFLNEELMVL